jgi:hypothetical protein
MTGVNRARAVSGDSRSSPSISNSFHVTDGAGPMPEGCAVAGLSFFRQPPIDAPPLIGVASGAASGATSGVVVGAGAGFGKSGGGAGWPAAEVAASAVAKQKKTSRVTG